ncbi:MAG: rRNA cytosine-C5-methyltransferase [Tannerellaceae bacterium]|jgi:16S rRNA C967 or C1407 C5-methylase (RsmB/RsmF family)/NOL1/NOP2/fmu family ribosome biogenesis protein|nr:rRNA cytosine-C5-methyltransferase [Tannerellaceae bacterium]
MKIPSRFTANMKALIGPEYEALEAALHETPPTSLRMNVRKGATPPEGEPVPWHPAGYYLPKRMAFTFHPPFHAGAYYVQEAASMFVGRAVEALVEGPVRCLDLCAAPGGKSTLLSDCLPEGSLLVCNEAIRNRVGVLAENIVKWGNPGAIVCNNDPADLGRLEHFFDIIVADMPCSGEGMFRKDPRSVDLWSPDAVRLCASRQRRIVADVWNALRPGGLFIYSTCTFNSEENEENVRFIAGMGAEALPVPLEASWGVAGNLRYDFPVYRFFPHRTKGEGFFMAVLRKLGLESPRRINVKREKRKASAPPDVTARLINPESFELEVRDNIVKAVRHINAADFAFLANHLRVYSAGLCVGEVKGKTVIPLHPLAMSVHLNREAFPNVEVDNDTAISYLRKDSIKLECQAGYALLTCDGLALGFGKQLGDRFNNLYPSEWRIRMERASGR